MSGSGTMDAQAAAAAAAEETPAANTRAADILPAETTQAAAGDNGGDPPGRPKRKRAAAARPVGFAGSSVDSDGGEDGDSNDDTDSDDDGDGDGTFGAGRRAKKSAGQAARKSAKRTSTKSTKSTKNTSATRKPNRPRATAEVRVAQRPRRAAADKGAVVTAAMAAGDADQADGNDDGDGDIYKKLFAPMTDQELQEWQGWCDIESEPDFFNFILHELGVRHATVHEVYGIDKDTLRSLANPLGLIFLYKYVEEDVVDDDRRQGCPDALWFANQTTDNACGTVAMLNIAMNADNSGLRLGTHLARFKAATRHLHPALRGHMLSTDAYIRAKHNAFARRLDMLAADAKLRDSWQEHEDSRGRRARKNSRTAKKKKTSNDDAAFHFIAYVPVGDDVWELNGMQPWPHKLDAVSGGQGNGHWTEAASERIAARMQGYDGGAGFSLLALCATGGSAEQSGTNGDYDDADADDADDADSKHRLAAAAARRGDYTPAVYCWLKKLADKGVLRRLATGDDG